MSNRCRIEGEADSRMRSGGSVPNKPLTNAGHSVVARFTIPMTWYRIWFGPILRSEKLQNERSPNCSNFVPNFSPNFAPNFPRIFRGVFVLPFVGNGDQKKFTKNPRLFSMQNSQANTKINIHKMFLESRHSNKSRKVLAGVLRGCWQKRECSQERWQRCCS